LGRKKVKTEKAKKTVQNAKIYILAVLSSIWFILAISKITYILLGVSTGVIIFSDIVFHGLLLIWWLLAYIELKRRLNKKISV